MEVNISSEQRLRISTNRNRIFADVSSTPYQESLTIEFYSFARQIIIKKNSTYKMFIFKPDQDENNIDYGFWNDGEIVWKSF